MANPSKRYPHYCEMFMENMGVWFPVGGAFKHEDEAEAKLVVLRKRLPEARLRRSVFNQEKFNPCGSKDKG